MKKSIVTVALLIISHPVWAGCPVTFVDADSFLPPVVKLIGAATSCDAAVTLAQDCFQGSSMDNAIAGSAVKVCSKDFASKLGADEAKAYKALNSKCAAKYNSEGTIYVSLSAQCQLRVAQLYSYVYSPAESLGD